MSPAANPFRVNALKSQRYLLAETQLDALAEAAHKLNYFACIRGPHGTGKSTLLEDLAWQLERRGQPIARATLHRQMPAREQYRVLQSILSNRASVIHCVDGGEALGMLSWLGFLACVQVLGKQLIATTHRPSLLPVLYQTRACAQTAQHLVQHLAGRHWSAELAELALASHARHQGNCREVFRDCYWYLSER